MSTSIGPQANFKEELWGWFSKKKNYIFLHKVLIWKFSDPTSHAYYSTAALDGESNLKEAVSLKKTANFSSPGEITQIRCYCEVQERIVLVLKKWCLLQKIEHKPESNLMTKTNKSLGQTKFRGVWLCMHLISTRPNSNAPWTELYLNLMFLIIVFWGIRATWKVSK